MRKQYVIVIALICGATVVAALLNTKKTAQTSQADYASSRADFTMKMADGREVELSELGSAQPIPAINKNFTDALQPPTPMAEGEEVGLGQELGDGWYAIYGITEFLLQTHPNGKQGVRLDSAGEKVGHHFYHLKKSAEPLSTTGYVKWRVWQNVVNSPETFGKLPQYDIHILPEYHPIATRIAILRAYEGGTTDVFIKQR